MSVVCPSKSCSGALIHVVRDQGELIRVNVRRVAAGSEYGHQEEVVGSESLPSVHSPQEAVGGDNHSHHLGPPEPCRSAGIEPEHFPDDVFPSFVNPIGQFVIVIPPVGGIGGRVQVSEPMGLRADDCDLISVPFIGGVTFGRNDECEQLPKRILGIRANVIAR